MEQFETSDQFFQFKPSASVPRRDLLWKIIASLVTKPIEIFVHGRERVHLRGKEER